MDSSSMEKAKLKFRARMPVFLRLFGFQCRNQNLTGLSQSLLPCQLCTAGKSRAPLSEGACTQTMFALFVGVQEQGHI